MDAITPASSLGVALRAAFGRAQSYTQGLRSHAIDVDVDVRCVQVCKCGARVYGGRMYLTSMSCEVGVCMCVRVCSCTEVCVSVMDAITTASSLGVALRAAFGRAQSYTQGLRSHAIDVHVDVVCA